MKQLRGSSRRVTAVWPMLIFAVAVLAGIPLRLYQTICLIEPETGFFTDKTNFSVPALYAVLGVAAALIVALSYICRGLPQDAPRSRSKTLGGLAAVLSVAFLADAGIQVYHTVQVFMDEAGMLGSAGMGRYLIMQLLTLGLQSLLAVLCCAYFALLGLSAFGKGPAYSRFKILAAVPVFWAVARTVNRFIRMINFKNVSDLLLELLMLAVLMLFFLAFARVNSRVEAKDNIWRLFAYGLTAAMLQFVISVPRLALIVCGMGDRIVDLYPLDVCDLLLPAFILAYLFISVQQSQQRRKKLANTAAKHPQ